MDIRNTILDDNVDLSTSEKVKKDDGVTFQPFNYETDNTVTPKKLKTGDVITVSKDVLKDKLGIDADEILKNLEGKEEIPNKLVEDENRISLTRDSGLGILNWEDQNKNKTKHILVDLSKVTVSEQEKSDFFRHTLAGETYTFNVSMNKGKSLFVMRNKPVKLQSALTNLISYLLTLKKPDSEEFVFSYTSMCEWMLKVEVVTTMLSFNGKKLFSFYDTYDVNKFTSSEELYELFKKDIEIIDRYPIPLWILLFNACRVREEKEKLLNEFMVNEDFC